MGLYTVIFRGEVGGFLVGFLWEFGWVGWVPRGSRGRLRENSCKYFLGIQIFFGMSRWVFSGYVFYRWFFLKFH